MSHNGSCPTLLKTNTLCNNFFYQWVKSHSLFFMWHFCIFFKHYNKIKLILKDTYMALKLLVGSPEGMLMTANPM